MTVEVFNYCCKWAWLGGAGPEVIKEALIVGVWRLQHPGGGGGGGGGDERAGILP